MGRILNLGFLASHRGSGMQAAMAAIADGSLRARTRVVISNNSDAPALAIAEAQGLPVYHLSQKKLGPNADLDQAILAALEDNGAELIVLSGYLRKLGEKTLCYYQDRVLNMHPSLLPKYGGRGMHGRLVHEAVIATGEKLSGASIHVVEGEYDTGPILAQRTVQIEVGDTPTDLARRITAIEPEFLVETLSGIADGRIELPSNR